MDCTENKVPESGEAVVKLDDAQKARIDENRQRALKRRAKLSRQNPKEHKKFLPADLEKLDTHAGFILHDAEPKQAVFVEKLAPLIQSACSSDKIVCFECGKEFRDAFLFNKYGVKVCDTCKDKEAKFRLITKSDAMKKYLLKDIDLDKREPILRYIIRKNPRNEKWGEMKLYLEYQVAERASEIWESDEAMEEAREQREKNKILSKQKKYDKKLKELKKNVRSSLWKKDSHRHEHDYGEEQYNKSDDVYSKVCITCSHILTYEKM